MGYIYKKKNLLYKTVLDKTEAQKFKTYNKQQTITDNIKQQKRQH